MPCQLPRTWNLLRREGHPSRNTALEAYCQVASLGVWHRKLEWAVAEVWTIERHCE